MQALDDLSGRNGFAVGRVAELSVRPATASFYVSERYEVNRSPWEVLISSALPARQGPIARNQRYERLIL